MVRNYKPKNRLYKNSKLSEEQVLVALAFTLALAPNAIISKKIGVTEKSLKVLQRKYGAHFRSSNLLVRSCLAGLVNCGAITPELREEFLNRHNEKSNDDWTELEACVFRCPKILRLRTSEGDLQRFLRKFDDAPAAKENAQIIMQVHGYGKGQETFKRVRCVDCRQILNCGVHPTYSHVYFAHINTYFERRAFRKSSLAEHLFPAFISFALYIRTMEHLGVQYPVSSPEQLPNFKTAKEFTDALIPLYVKNASEFVTLTHGALIEDPI